MTSHPLEKSTKFLIIFMLTCSRSKCGSRTVASSGGSSTWKPNRCVWFRGDSSTQHRRPATTNSRKIFPIKIPAEENKKFRICLIFFCCKCLRVFHRLPKFYYATKKESPSVSNPPPNPPTPPTSFIDSFDVNNSRFK